MDALRPFTGNKQNIILYAVDFYTSALASVYGKDRNSEII